MTAQDLLARVRQEIEARLPGVVIPMSIRISVYDTIGHPGNQPPSIRWLVSATRQTSDRVSGYMIAEGAGCTPEEALHDFLHGSISIEQLVGADEKALARIDL
ncbi:MAG: hypothetical protein KGL39_46175 [Patescibacteria group bacterium]|nr:hypothetical protein [Patescibacteria group bacterium]